MKRELSSGPGLTDYIDQVTTTVEDGQTSYGGTYNLPTRYNRLETIGVNTPQYHLKRKRGELLPLTYFEQFDCFGSVTGTHRSLNGTTGAVTTMEPRWVPPGWLITKQECKDLLAEFDAEPYVQAAAAKIYSDGYDALTFLAELKDTVRMFRGIVPQIIKHITWKRPKSLRKNISVATRDVSNAWMEGRYGWRTLLYDVEDLNKALCELGAAKRKRWKESVGNTSETQAITSTVSSESQCTYERVVTTNWSIGQRGTVVADIIPPAIQFNPVVTAWELTKLSFVVDWVVDVGQFLESMSFLALASDYTAATGYYVRGVRTLTASVPSWNSPFTGIRTLEGKCEAEYRLRTPASVSKLPHIGLNLSWLKVGDLMALLRQALNNRS